MSRVTRRGRDAVDIASMQGERVGGGVRTRRRRELPGWLAAAESASSSKSDAWVLFT